MKTCKYCGTKYPNEQSKCNSCGATEFIHICDNCGNTFEEGKFCPRCGVKVGTKPKTCPNCGTVYYSNACSNCGYTGYAPQSHGQAAPKEAPKPRRTWLWVLGWIFIFPVPTTILLVRNKKMNAFAKAILIFFAWLAFFAFLEYYGDDEETSTVTNQEIVVVESFQ